MKKTKKLTGLELNRRLISIEKTINDAYREKEALKKAFIEQNKPYPTGTIFAIRNGVGRLQYYMVTDYCIAAKVPIKKIAADDEYFVALRCRSCTKTGQKRSWSTKTLHPQAVIDSPYVHVPTAQ